MEKEATLSHGNGVLASPDGLLVYVTMSNGALQVLSAFDGGNYSRFKPSPIAEGWSVTCNSGVYFGQKRNGERYAIWAVIDVPPDLDAEDYSSRIIAVDYPPKRIMWISESIPGAVEGKPVATRLDSGEFIFFTHNQIDLTTGEIVGSFSMLNGADGTLMFTEVAGESRFDPDESSLGRVDTLRLPYSALGVSHSPAYGRYPGGESNEHDLFVWSTSTLGGRGDNGYTRAFQLPKLFNPESAPDLFTHFLRETRWCAIAPPALSSDGMDVVFGVRSNGVRGWTGLDGFHEVAHVAHDLGNDPNDERRPIPFQPVFSISERYFFVATSTSYLYSINAATGDIEWSVVDVMPMSNKPVVSPDDKYVYVTRENGAVAAYDLGSGEEFWSLTCQDLQDQTSVSESVSRSTISCVDLVETESSISPSGLVFFYGDKFGNVKALQLGNSIEPTEAPSGFPTAYPSETPSAVPSDLPSMVPTETHQPTSTPTISPRPTGPPIDWEALGLPSRDYQATANGDLDLNQGTSDAAPMLCISSVRNQFLISLIAIGAGIFF